MQGTRTGTLPTSPLYDPKAQVNNFKFAEDFENIRLNLAGTGELFKDPNFYYYLGDREISKGNMQHIEWRRPKEICSNPKFVKGKHDRFDALQGRGDNCWVVGAMEALTLNEPLVCHVAPTDQSFKDNQYIGAFHFRIWELGTWYDVVVDDRLPVYKKNKKLFYCRSRSGDVFWAALLEKAYAKYWGTSSGDMTYDVLDTGAFATSFTNFTGGITEMICSNSDLQKKYGHFPPSGTTLKRFLYEAHRGNALMGALAFGRLAQSAKGGILPSHTYPITKIIKCADDDPVFSHQGVGLYILRILNPWGQHEFTQDWSDDERFDDEWKANASEINNMIRQMIGDDGTEDGEFWMSENSFEKHFALVFVCHLGPGQLTDTRFLDLDLLAWKTTFYRGSWVANFSSVGPDPTKRHLLPQCRLELKDPEDTTVQGALCYVIMHLTHRGKYRDYVDCIKKKKKGGGRKKKCDENNVGFYIYETSSESTEGRLEEKFFELSEPLNEEPDWDVGDGRSYTLAAFLEAGRYCIIPCTRFANVTSQFLLRVFTTNDLEKWEYDYVISKSSPIADHNQDYTETWVRSLFTDVTQHQEDIDWKGLKYILDAAFNANFPLFGMFTSIAYYILNIFGALSSTRSYNDFEHENVVFTKDQCRNMVAMLDHNRSGKLDYTEFIELWNKINFWMKVYKQYRDETVGHLRVGQLKEALGAIGYNIDTRQVHTLSYVYADDEGKILVADFVLCGVALERALSRMENEALKSSNKMTLTLQEWVTCTLGF